MTTRSYGAELVRALAITLLTVAPTYSQTADDDADNLEQAFGMMHADVVMSQKMLSECSRRLPAYKEEMERNLHQWEEKESADILKMQDDLEQHTKVLKDNEQKMLADFTRSLEATVTQQLDAAASATPPSVAELCRSTFSDIASGVGRQRQPRMYKFLDEAPVRRKTDAVH